MTTTDLALAPQAGNGLATAVPSLGAVEHDALDQLRRWVAAASDAATLVRPLVNSAFVPDAYRPKVDPRASVEEKVAAFEVAVANGTAAVLQGISLGIDPLMALQNIYIVHGRPGLYAKFAVALVQARGHEVWTEDSTDTRAVVCGRRRGSDFIERVAVTMDMAKRAGWTRNDTYAKTPTDMLWNRAASRVCDRIASDVLRGVPVVDELQPSVTVEATGSRTVQRAAARPALPPAAEPASERPPLPGEATDGQQDAASAASGPGPSGPLDEAQWRKINARFVELGVTGPGQQNARLYVIGRMLDRVIEKGSDLSAAEGDLVLSTLQGTTRERIAALLDERNRVEPGQAPPQVAREPQGPPLPGEDDDEPRAARQDDIKAEADELTDDTLEPGEDEGRPAALDGVTDPWADQ